MAMLRQLAFLSRPTYDGATHFGSSHRDDMSRKDIVFVVSRAFALLLISWAFLEVTYLPERLFALSHHLSQSSVLVAHDYWSSYYLIITAFLVLRMLALFLAAAFFGDADHACRHSSRRIRKIKKRQGRVRWVCRVNDDIAI